MPDKSSQYDKLWGALNLLNIGGRGGDTYIRAIDDVVCWFNGYSAGVNRDDYHCPVDIATLCELKIAITAGKRRASE